MGQQKSILSRDVFPILIADSEFDFGDDEPLTGNASVMQQIAAFAVAGENEDERINFECNVRKSIDDQGARTAAG